MDRETLIFACGLHSLCLALFHVAFWKLFDWPSSLQSTGLATRAIVQILNLRLIHVFLGVAALCFFLPQDMAGTRLGQALLAGMSLFWIGRTIEQFVFLRVNHPFVHALTLVFASGAVLFALPLFVGD